MSGVSCVIFYAGKMLQTIEFSWVALNINLFGGPLFSYYVTWGLHRISSEKGGSQILNINKAFILRSIPRTTIE
jgi:hypothetical protein